MSETIRGRRRIRTITAGLALVVLSIFLQGCGDETVPLSPDPPDEPATGTQQVAEYFRSLPSWAEYAELQEEQETVADEPSIYEQEGNLVCSVTEASITKNPEDIITFSPDSEIMWLGSLIQGRGHRAGLGSLQELPVRQRDPLTVSIDILFSDNTRTVENPDLASVTQAIGELIDAAEMAGHTAGSSIFFNQAESHSLEQSALKLGLSASYMGNSVRSSLETDRAAGSSSLTATFTQKMFTTSMVLPQSPVDVFSSDFTEALLREQVDRGNLGPQNLPVYVGSITWGRMLVVTMTSDSSASSMKGALKASASYAGAGVSADLSAEHEAILSNSELNVVAIGGHAQAVIDLIRSGRLGAYFKEDAPLTSARPISYVLRNLGDNTIARVSETTEYSIRECEPGGVQRFDTYASWRDSVHSSGLNEHELMTTSENIALADGVYAPPAGALDVGPRLTFSGDSTSLPFDFYLENTSSLELADPSHQRWGLVFRDQEFYGGADRWISIGDVDGTSGGAYRDVLENDDFDVRIVRDDSAASGSAVYAVAFTVGDNTSQGGESVIVRGDGFEVKFTDDLNGFIGFVSPFPITNVHFDEDPGGDDIGIRDFHFGSGSGSGDNVGGGLGS